YVSREAQAFGLSHRVIVHGRVPRAEALSAVRGANVAVVISSIYEDASLQDRSVVTGKVFEAIGLGTSILVIAPKGSDLEGILAVTGLGTRFAGTETDRMVAFLKDAMNGKKVSPGDLTAYAWPRIASRLDAILRGVLSGEDREKAAVRI